MFKPSRLIAMAIFAVFFLLFSYGISIYPDGDGTYTAGLNPFIYIAIWLVVGFLPGYGFINICANVLVKRGIVEE